MFNKFIFGTCLIFITMIWAADNPEKPQNTDVPTYSGFIGKKFVQINEIDSALSAGQFGALYEDGNYSICIYGNDHYLNKSKNSRFNYVFLTKKAGRQGTHSIKQILDIVAVDMSNFNDSASIRLDECECKGQAQCQTIAIYNAESKAVKKGKKIKPFKVWQPNIATGKLEEKPTESFKCGPQEEEEE